MYERQPSDEGYVFPTVAIDEAYLAAVAVLATKRGGLPDKVRGTVLTIEQDSVQELAKSPFSNVAVASRRNIGFIAAMRDFGLLHDAASVEKTADL